MLPLRKPGAGLALWPVSKLATTVGVWEHGDAPTPPPGFGFLRLNGQLLTLNGKNLMLENSDG